MSAPTNNQLGLSLLLLSTTKSSQEFTGNTGRHLAGTTKMDPFKKFIEDVECRARAPVT